MIYFISYKYSTFKKRGWGLERPKGESGSEYK
jgi:hypothetical protein